VQNLRLPSYQYWSDGTYRFGVVDNDGRREWGAYLDRVTNRPGWSVARLAREAGLSRQTIFDWKRGGTGKSVTIGSVLAIARAVDDDPLTTFRAAASLFAVESDPEIASVVNAKLDGIAEAQIIDSIIARRRSDEERRIADTERMIELARGRAS